MKRNFSSRQTHQNFVFFQLQALQTLGLLNAFGELTTKLIDQFPSEYHMFVAVVILVWVSALASSFIDNIPFTEAMIPVIISLQENNENLILQPLGLLILVLHSGSSEKPPKLTTHNSSEKINHNHMFLKDTAAQRWIIITEWCVSIESWTIMHKNMQ